jgi:hypothetical protein
MKSPHIIFFPNEVRLNIYGFNFSVVRYFFRYNFAQTNFVSDIQNELRRKFGKIHSKKKSKRTSKIINEVRLIFGYGLLRCCKHEILNNCAP